MYRLLLHGCLPGNIFHVSWKNRPQRYIHLGYYSQEGKYVGIILYMREFSNNRSIIIHPLLEPHGSTNINQRNPQGNYSLWRTLTIIQGIITRIR